MQIVFLFHLFNHSFSLCTCFQRHYDYHIIICNNDNETLNIEAAIHLHLNLPVAFINSKEKRIRPRRALHDITYMFKLFCSIQSKGNWPLWCVVSKPSFICENSWTKNGSECLKLSLLYVPREIMYCLPGGSPYSSLNHNYNHNDKMTIMIIGIRLFSR